MLNRIPQHLRPPGLFAREGRAQRLVPRLVSRSPCERSGLASPCVPARSWANTHRQHRQSKEARRTLQRRACSKPGSSTSCMRWPRRYRTRAAAVMPRPLQSGDSRPLSSNSRPYRNCTAPAPHPPLPFPARPVTARTARPPENVRPTRRSALLRKQRSPGRAACITAGQPPAPLLPPPHPGASGSPPPYPPRRLTPAPPSCTPPRSLPLSSPPPESQRVLMY